MTRSVLLLLCIIFLLLFMVYSCKKDSTVAPLHFYEVGFNGNAANWRDSSFIIATDKASLIEEIEAQLRLPVVQRKIVNGLLLSGNGGYNKNASHSFKWRFKENDWQLADLSIEIYDGRPYSDVDANINYWLNTVKRFSPWGSYIKKEITP